MGVAGGCGPPTFLLVGLPGGEVGKGGAAPSADILCGFGRWLLKQMTMQLTA